jgi:WD40 repeat protein
LRVNLSRKNLKTVSENAKISALDVAAGNTILVADTGNNASSATKISLFDAEKDKTFQTYTSTTKIARNGLKQSPCLNIFGALFHDETNGGCIKIYDLRMQGPTATIYNTCMHNTFDYSGDGSYICSSSSKSKDLMIYTIGQQKVKFSKFKITDPGIITNIYNDYFAVTSYEPSIGSYFATVNVENLVNNVHYQEDVFPQNGEHGILQNLITCKKTGLFLFHYIKNQQTTFFCATANRVYGTTMKYPHPHNIACLYAVQKSARGADIELLRDTKYKSPIDDTIFNDGLFAQVMKEDANT